MPKYFPLVKTVPVEVIVEVPVGDGSSVADERLQYDLPEIHSALSDDAVIGPSVAETTPIPEAVDILAVLLDADEFAPLPATDISNTEAIFQLDETLPSLDELGLVIVTFGDGAAPLTSMVVIEADVSFLQPNASVRTTGWNDVGNLLDSDDGTEAFCEASSSGIAGTGTVPQETESDLEVSFPDLSLDDLTIDSVELSWSIRAEISSVNLTSGRCEIDYDYSLDDGATWVNFFAQRTIPNGSTSSLDITSSVGGNWQKIQDFRMRAVGTVYSGTGVLSVTARALWAYGKLRILASKAY